MNKLYQLLHLKFKKAITATFGEPYQTFDPTIQIATTASYGDYQANAALKLAKPLKQAPQAIAKQIVQALENDPLFEMLEVSGPGFINITLSNAVLNEHFQDLITDPRLGILEIQHRETIVIDYGGPNVAKEMHVGHLRSTVIGDAIARLLGFLGHHVIRQNHIGDWGTQFGMLIQHMIDTNWQVTESHSIGSLNAIYKEAKVRFDSEPAFAKKARERVVSLQAGDIETVALWKQLVKQSEIHFQHVFSKLDVLLTPNDICAESFYNPMLENIVHDLKSQHISTTSQDAEVVFLNDFVDKNQNLVPLIIQKSDGGYLYATTDLAGIHYRINHLKAQRLIYVVDARQRQHFDMVFATARKTNWITEKVRFDYVPFGSILGHDKKPFKTRSGETIKLIDLIHEAEKRAQEIITEKKSTLSDDEQKALAHAIGIGALKYADLSTDKIKDYIFDWDHMLSFEGNTAPYLQNAYVRIQSLFRKGNIDPTLIRENAIAISDPMEHMLALKLIRFSGLIPELADDLQLHRLCTYLYELAALFHRFYEQCPVLTAHSETQKITRLLLCDVSARTLKLGLALLGIQVIDKM